MCVLCQFVYCARGVHMMVAHVWTLSTLLCCDADDTHKTRHNNGKNNKLNNFFVCALLFLKARSKMDFTVHMYISLNASRARHARFKIKSLNYTRVTQSCVNALHIQFCIYIFSLLESSILFVFVFRNTNLFFNRFWHPKK